MSKPINYSKWDRLDISDDEKDYHPNIDASLMIRIKREQRAKREAEEADKIASLKSKGTAAALEQVKAIEEKQKLHVGNICRVVDEKTIVSSTTKVRDATHSTTKNHLVDEDTAMAIFMEEHDALLCEYATIQSIEDTEAFLYLHPEILHEHGCAHLLLKQLALEMEGHTKEMVHAVRQYLILRNILDLGKEARQGEEVRPMVKLFFKTINKDSSKRAALDSESVLFSENIKLRAAQKRAEQRSGDHHSDNSDNSAVSDPE